MNGTLLVVLICIGLIWLLVNRSQLGRSGVNQRVISYRNQGECDRDVQRMGRAGWVVQSISTTQDGRPLGKILVMGVFARQRIRYTVIYTRQ